MENKAFMNHMKGRLEDMKKYGVTPSYIEGYEEALDHMADYLEIGRE